MYKILILLVIQITILVNLKSQNNNFDDCLHCKSPAFVELKSQLINQILTTPRLKSGTECDKKIVKLNIYYIQNNIGGNNFSAAGDGLGNSYNGKDFAYEMLNSLNTTYSNNTKLRIPPNNNISVNSKDIQFIIEGIYYIQNSNINQFRINGNFTFSNTDYNNYAINKDSVLHLFIQADDPSSNSWGGVGFSAGNYICMANYGRYLAYKTNINQGDQWGWVIGAESGLWAHEIGHSLSLDHTVLWGGGANCPCLKFPQFGALNPSCDDGIPNNETPSATYMTDVLNAPIHPGDRSANAALRAIWLSNNQMDYASEGAMSPMQIQLMHVYLYQQKPAWLVENAQWLNKNYCSWIGNRIAHYGKSITLNKNCSANLKVTSGTTRKVVSSQSTEIFGGFEVLAGSEFEIVNTCTKP